MGDPATRADSVKHVNQMRAQLRQYVCKLLRERFPRLITCDISGYGEGGPWGERKAYEREDQHRVVRRSGNGPRWRRDCGQATGLCAS